MNRKASICESTHEHHYICIIDTVVAFNLCFVFRRHSIILYPFIKGLWTESAFIVTFISWAILEKWWHNSHQAKQNDFTINTIKLKIISIICKNVKNPWLAGTGVFGASSQDWRQRSLKSKTWWKTTLAFKQTNQNSEIWTLEI